MRTPWKLQLFMSTQPQSSMIDHVLSLLPTDNLHRWEDTWLMCSMATRTTSLSPSSTSSTPRWPVVLNAKSDQFVGWDWLLAWGYGYWPRQGTSLANRWHKLSINLLIVTDSIFSLCFSWCPSLKGAAMEFTDFKNNEEPAGQPFLHMNFDDGFKWDPFLWMVLKFFFLCWFFSCSKFFLCKPFFLFRDPFLIVI